MAQFPSPVVSFICSCNLLGVFVATLFMNGAFSIVFLDSLINMFFVLLFSSSSLNDFACWYLCWFIFSAILRQYWHPLSYLFGLIFLFCFAFNFIIWISSYVNFGCSGWYEWHPLQLQYALGCLGFGYFVFS